MKDYLTQIYQNKLPKNLKFIPKFLKNNYPHSALFSSISFLLFSLVLPSIMSYLILVSYSQPVFEYSFSNMSFLVAMWIISSLALTLFSLVLCHNYNMVNKISFLEEIEKYLNENKNDKTIQNLLVQVYLINLNEEMKKDLSVNQLNELIEKLQYIELTQSTFDELTLLTTSPATLNEYCHKNEEFLALPLENLVLLVKDNLDKVILSEEKSGKLKNDVLDYNELKKPPSIKKLLKKPHALNL